MLEQELKEALVKAGYPPHVNVSIDSMRILAGYKTPTTMWLTVKIQEPLSPAPEEKKWEIERREKL